MIYQCNYYDDYDPTDGLCSFVTARLESDRERFVARCGAPSGDARLAPRQPQSMRVVRRPLSPPSPRT
ncbi:MAG TPA: hypothetical protein VGI81_06800 [Tepidisphaeraceae bacterium]